MIESTVAAWLETHEDIVEAFGASAPRVLVDLLGGPELMPCVVVTHISGAPLAVHNAAQAGGGLYRARLQLDVYARGAAAKASVGAIADALVALLTAYAGDIGEHVLRSAVVDNRRSLATAADPPVCQESIDVLLLYRVG